MKKFFDIKIWLLFSLTLGLAPFSEPHIIGKIKWILGGAKGMQLLDWFDFLMHATPWILLIVSIIFYFRDKNKLNSDAV